MSVTCYVLEDGTAARPEDVSRGDDGVLRHADGRAVAYAPHGPRTRSVDETEPEPAKIVEADRDMKPQPARRYKTR